MDERRGPLRLIFTLDTHASQEFPLLVLEAIRDMPFTEIALDIDLEGWGVKQQYLDLLLSKNLKTFRVLNRHSMRALHDLTVDLRRNLSKQPELSHTIQHVDFERSWLKTGTSARVFCDQLLWNSFPSVTSISDIEFFFRVNGGPFFTCSPTSSLLRCDCNDNIFEAIKSWYPNLEVTKITRG